MALIHGIATDTELSVAGSRKPVKHLQVKKHIPIAF